jgi:hypothetical protein
MDVCMFVELLQLLEVESENLLRSEDLSLPTDGELKSDSLVLQWDYLLSNVLFFFL